MFSSVKTLFKSPDTGWEQSEAILSAQEQLARLEQLRMIYERKPDYDVGDWVCLDPVAVDLGLAADYRGNTEVLPPCGYVLRLATDWLSDVPVKRPQDPSVVLLAIASFDDHQPPVVFRKFDHRLFRKAPTGTIVYSIALVKFVQDKPVDGEVAAGTLVRVRAGHRIDNGVFSSKSLSSVKSGGFVRGPLIVLARPEPAEGNQERLTLAYFADDACHLGRTVTVYPYELCRSE